MKKFAAIISNIFGLLPKLLPNINDICFQLEIPLAFSHLIHRDVGIFEVFMATTYHPQNSHCIFVDAKASEKVKRAVDGIVNCYEEKYLKASITLVFCDGPFLCYQITKINDTNP
jgi:hypothetical protein